LISLIGASLRPLRREDDRPPEFCIIMPMA
jgi:hypothetical protein